MKAMLKFCKKLLLFGRFRKNQIYANLDNTILQGLTCYNSYGGYFVPKSSKHRPAAQLVLQGKIYEPDTISLIRDHCGKGDVIHAGTFFGDFLPGIATALYTESKIWAFEPNPENYKCAKITCLINDLKNVELFEAALDEKKAVSHLAIATNEGVSLGGASFVANMHTSAVVVEIQTLRLDDVIPPQRKVSIIQLDIEGYENNALKGGLNIVKRNLPILILEDYKDIVKSFWFRQNILPLGYMKVGQVHNNSIFKVNNHNI